MSSLFLHVDDADSRWAGTYADITDDVRILSYALSRLTSSSQLTDKERAAVERVDGALACIEDSGESGGLLCDPPWVE